MFNCDVCGSAFATKKYLFIHTKTHATEDNHPCDVCEKQFETSTSLLEHKNTVHEETFGFGDFNDALQDLQKTILGDGSPEKKSQRRRPRFLRRRNLPEPKFENETAGEDADGNLKPRSRKRLFVGCEQSEERKRTRNI